MSDVRERPCLRAWSGTVPTTRTSRSPDRRTGRARHQRGVDRPCPECLQALQERERTASGARTASPATGGTAHGDARLAGHRRQGAAGVRWEGSFRPPRCAPCFVLRASVVESHTGGRCNRISRHPAPARAGPFLRATWVRERHNGGVIVKAVNLHLNLAVAQLRVHQDALALPRPSRIRWGGRWPAARLQVSPSL